MDDSRQPDRTPTDLLYTIGIAAAATGIRSFQSRRFTAIVSTTRALSHVWLGYAAFAKESGEWIFARFAPATECQISAGTSAAFSVALDVEDLSGRYSGPEYRHTLVPLGISEDGVFIGFDSAQRGVAAVDSVAKESTPRLAVALRTGDVFAMRDLLRDRRYLTQSVDGALVGCPSGRRLAAIRVDAVLDPRPKARFGLDAMGLFPRRAF